MLSFVKRSMTRDLTGYGARRPSVWLLAFASGAAVVACGSSQATVPSPTHPTPKVSAELVAVVNRPPEKAEPVATSQREHPSPDRWKLDDRGRERLVAFARARSAHLADASANGSSLLVLQETAGVQQLFVVQKPLGQRRQVTFGGAEVVEASFWPGSSTWAMVVQQSGSGQQLVAINTDTGDRSELLTSEGSLGNVSWSPSGRMFAVIETPLPPASSSVLRLGQPGSLLARAILLDGERRLIGWSQREDAVVSVRSSEQGTAVVEVVNILTESHSSEELSYESIRDAVPRSRGAELLLAVSESGMASKLVSFQPSTGEWQTLYAHPAREVQTIAAAPERQDLAMVVGQGGGSHLLLASRKQADPGLSNVRLFSGKSLAALGPASISAMRFFGDEGHLAVEIDSWTSPKDVYVLDIDRDKLEQWTSSELGGVSQGALLAPEKVSIAGANPEEPALSAHYYRPRGVGPFPAVLWLEGPVGTAHQAAYRPLLQYLVSDLKLAVLAPDVRGTVGYDADFAAMDDQKQRSNAVLDVGRSLLWLRQRTDVQAEHIAMVGDEYGGWLSLMSLIEFSDQLAAAAVFSPLPDLQQYVAKAPARYKKRLRREFGDEREPQQAAMLRSLSPSANAELLQKPVLIGAPADQLTPYERTHSATLLSSMCRLELNSCSRAEWLEAAERLAAFLEAQLGLGSASQQPSAPSKSPDAAQKQVSLK